MKCAHIGTTKHAPPDVPLALGEPARNRLPLTEVLIDEPVDHLADTALDLQRHVRDNGLGELLLHSRPVQQIDNASDAQRALEEPVATRLHVRQHLRDAFHAELEPALQVAFLEQRLAADVCEQFDVAPQQRQSIASDADIPGRQRRGHAERVHQLQTETALWLQRFLDEFLESIESAGLPQPGLAVLRAHRELRAHSEDRWFRPEEAACPVCHERLHLIAVAGALEDVHLVDRDDDLLPPVAQRLEELTFRFGKRPIGRCDEDHQVRARHEVRGQLFVIAHDRVRARRVDDVHVTKEVDRCSDYSSAIGGRLARRCLAILQQVQSGGRRNGALFQDGAPDKRVDRGAFPRVELAGHHDEKQVVELANRGVQRLEICARAKLREHLAERPERLARLG